MAVSSVQLVDFYGSDVRVANSARISFDRLSEPAGFHLKQDKRIANDVVTHGTIDVAGAGDRDKKLIKYLAEHKHELPFAHCQATFRIEAPVFVARQLAKSQVGFVWSEVSRRYVSSDPEFFWPKLWRGSTPDKKQGSKEGNWNIEDIACINWEVDNVYKTASVAYKELLARGVCEEQARMVLPQGMMTEWVWTGSLLGWARVYNLRVSPDAQAETKEIAERIGEFLEPLFPESWKALTNG